MIETWGFTPAVEAADTGMKTADVRLLACELTHSALMTVAFSGDVAAVQTAVNAAAVAAARVGRVVGTHMIPRPDASLMARFDPQSVPPPTPPTADKSLEVREAKPQADAPLAGDGSGPAKKEEKKGPDNPAPKADETVKPMEKEKTSPRPKSTAVKKQTAKKTKKAQKPTTPRGGKAKPPAKSPK